MKNKQISENISASACNYMAPFIFAFIFGFIGGVCGVLGYRYNSYANTMEPTPAAYLGVLFLLICIIFNFVAFKAFITDAHVKALEIFYGKERAINNHEEEYKDKTTIKNKKTYGWQNWD